MRGGKSVKFPKRGFLQPVFNFKVEFVNRTESDHFKKITDSTDTILIKPDKLLVHTDLKQKLFGEKTKKLSKEKQLKSLTLSYGNVFLYDLQIL